MFTSAKVGEWTRAMMPRPRARPFTNRVLPAPRSPHKPITNPLWAARPQVSPSASVSAGLCEMHVAICGEWSRAVLVFDGDALARRDFADATELELGELCFPGIQQRNGIAASNRKEKLKILPVRQRGQQRRFGWSLAFCSEPGGPADGNRRGEQFRSDSTGL